MTSAQCPAITISKLLILLSLNLWFVNEAVELQSPFWQLGEPQLTQGTASTTSGPPCLLVPGVPPTSPFLLPPLAGRTTRPLNQASVGDWPPLWLGVAHREGRRASYPGLECRSFMLPGALRILPLSLCGWGSTEESA